MYPGNKKSPKGKVCCVLLAKHFLFDALPPFVFLCPHVPVQARTYGTTLRTLLHANCSIALCVFPVCVLVCGTVHVPAVAHVLSNMPTPILALNMSSSFSSAAPVV